MAQITIDIAAIIAARLARAITAVEQAHGHSPQVKVLHGELENLLARTADHFSAPEQTILPLDGRNKPPA